MKILIAGDTYYPHVNGASYFTQRLAASLHRAGHTVAVLAPSRTWRGEHYERAGVLIYGMSSVSVLFYNNFRVVNPFFLKRAVRRVMEEFKPDVIHVQSHFTIVGAAIAVARARGIPVVATNHFMPDNLVHYLRLPMALEKFLVRMGWRWSVRVLSRADYVTTPTETAAGFLKRGGMRKNVVAVSCGIDLSKFRPGHSSDGIRERYGVPAGASMLLYVGRLDKEKQIDVIVRALPLIAKITKVHLVLAGTGAERRNLEALVRAIGVRDNVTFAGFVPDADLPKLYAAADLFVIAGIAELQSLVTMEAMASGLPVVAVNASALPELVHDGENGYLFPPGDHHVLAERVSAILADPEKKARMAGESLRIIQAHDIGKTIATFTKIYTDVIEKARVGSRLKSI